MVYKSEENMVREETKGFNEHFKRYKMGPWSLTLAQDANSLIENDFINRQEYAYFPTRRSIKL